MPQNYAYNRNYGKVKRLYATTGKVFFRLTGGRTEMNPSNAYYYVPASHGNYKALISLLYLAADNRRTIYARTKPNLDAKGRAEVQYFVMDC